MIITFKDNDNKSIIEQAISKGVNCVIDPIDGTIYDLDSEEVKEKIKKFREEALRQLNK